MDIPQGPALPGLAAADKELCVNSKVSSILPDGAFAQFMLLFLHSLVQPQDSRWRGQIVEDPQ